MAKKKQMEGPKGAAPWMTTFSDLMNLLLCFFVLLFAMSTVNEEKFQMVIASLQSSISIFNNGSLSIGEGDLVGAGIRQLEFLDSYYNELANSKSEEANGKASALKMKTEDVEVIKEKTASSKSVQSKVANTERHQAIIAEVADRVVFDEEANRNIAVARIGALFDCEKRMINC